MVKFDCHTETLAGELAGFLRETGWLAEVRGSAVFSDCPKDYSGCYCNAMIKFGVPNKGDQDIVLS